jgi:DNA-binding Lrp family transcriptional regulator
VDVLDVKILRELIIEEPSLTLQPDIRRSFDAIAKKLGVAEDTVRKRVNRFGKDGIIRGWRVGLNPNVFGYQTSYLFFELGSPAEKERVLSKLREVSGVLWVNDYMGGFAGVLLAYKDEADMERKLRPFPEIRNSKSLTRVNNRFPATNVTLLSVDRRIIGAIRRDPRKSFEKIAGELGISARTARRRLQRMTRERALFIFPDIDIERIVGSVVITLGVSYLDRRNKREIEGEIMSRFGDYYVFTPPPAQEYTAYSFVLPNLVWMEQMRIWVGALPGVKDVSIRPLLAFYNQLAESFQQEIERKAETGTATNESTLYSI